MNRRLIYTSLVALFTVVSLPRCTSCWDDPDDPKIWVKKLKEAESANARETAIFNLYRIYEVKKALMEKDPKKKSELEAFRKLVNPSLVEVFNKKLNNVYVLPDQIVEKLVIFEADNDSAQNLFVDLVKKYTNGDLDEITKDEDRQETLAAKAVDGLSKMALRKHLHAQALPTIWDLIQKVCTRRGGAGKVEIQGLDPRSFVRNAVVKSMPNFLKGGADRGMVAKILAKVVEFGQLEKSGQDPMVTIFSIIELGEVGDTSDETVKALVLALLGKGRGRRFFSFAATAVAQLPLRGNQHPAVPPLLLMLKGDPWMKVILEKKLQIAELKKKNPEPKKEIKELQAELDPLDKKYKEKQDMPACPDEFKRYPWVCTELFWKANVQDWEKSEPGVIPMNALMVLREIGAQEAVELMLKRYGIDTVEKRWLREALNSPMGEDKKDKSLPGVQMQKMVIEHYGSDMNIRSVMLRALGRMNAGATNPEAKKELQRSLTWSGDPTMLVKAGEGIYLNDYDEELMNALIEQTTKSASFMMVNFKKRQVKMFFWGKVQKGSCAEGATYEEKFKECLNDPKPLKGEKEVKDANWNCFEMFKQYWLPEFYYAIRYHKAGDYKRLVQPFCQKEDSWYSKTRVKMEQELKSASNAADRKRISAGLYACSENPDPKLLKKGDTVKCGEWAVCGPQNNFLCLDGQWQLRMHFYKHAALYAPYKYVDVLMKMSSEDIMKPHGLREKDLPQKEGKEASVFYDNDDKMYLNTFPWPDNVETLRQAKAKTILEEQLCQDREYLRVVKRCNQDINCYVSVIKGAASMQLDAEDCTNLKPPYTQSVVKKVAPTWRHKLKALRMLAYLVQTAEGGQKKAVAEKAIAAAVGYYDASGRLKGSAMTESRDMILLVIDRAGDALAQKNVMCDYPYVERKRDMLAEKYSLPRYREELARAEQYKRDKQIEKYKKLIKQYEEKVEKELEEAKKPQPCFKILKLIINDETRRSVKGTWQINRDARNCLGRLARRSKIRYDQI